MSIWQWKRWDTVQRVENRIDDQGRGARLFGISARQLPGAGASRGSLFRNDDHWSEAERQRGQQDPTQSGAPLRRWGLNPFSRSQLKPKAHRAAVGNAARPPGIRAAPAGVRHRRKPTQCSSASSPTTTAVSQWLRPWRGRPGARWARASTLSGCQLRLPGHSV